MVLGGLNAAADFVGAAAASGPVCKSSVITVRRRAEARSERVPIILNTLFT
jgi:hypothetical protein